MDQMKNMTGDDWKRVRVWSVWIFYFGLQIESLTKHTTHNNNNNNNNNQTTRCKSKCHP